jgi:hypothetical protein
MNGQPQLRQIKVSTPLIIDASEQAQGRKIPIRQRFNQNLNRILYSLFESPSAPSRSRRPSQNKSLVALLAAISVFSSHNWGLKDLKRPN